MTVNIPNLFNESDWENIILLVWLFNYFISIKNHVIVEYINIYCELEQDDSLWSLCAKDMTGLAILRNKHILYNSLILRN